MRINLLANWIKSNPRIKKVAHILIVHRRRPRPRWWVRNLLMPLLMKRGSGSYISKTVRRDVFPFHNFEIGHQSVVEDFATLNNGIGYIKIGDNCRVGIGSVVIGQIDIGNNVVTGQHCLLVGLSHNYQDVDRPMSEQGAYVNPIVIEDCVTIGANSVILPGVSIGAHSFIAAGSVVSKSVPSYSVVSGPVAKVVFDMKNGVKVK